MMNQCNFIGRLGRDPVLKQDHMGVKAFCTIAVSEKWTNSDGSKGERTNWIPLAFRGRLAEIVGEYLKKGSLIFVSGSLDIISEPDGKGGYKTNVRLRVNSLTMLPSERADGTNNAQVQVDYSTQSKYQRNKNVATDALKQAQSQVNSAQNTFANTQNITPNVSDDDMPF